MSLAAGLLSVAPCTPAAEPENAFPPMPPIQALTPEDSAKKFQLPPGYHLELVVGDPIIKDPVVAAFDGDGAMFVAEMRSYMRDADGTDQLAPIGRVSLHSSTKGDANFDRHTVFIDHLVLPRMILPLGKGQLVVGESQTLDLFLYTDTDGDGVADKKELWFAGGPHGGIVEHQSSGLVWCADNWIYTTVNAWRLRWTPHGVIQESTAGNEGQWGLSQDDFGKPWPMNARGERGPVNFQVPMMYGPFRIKGEMADGFDEVWPLPGLADVQGGAGRYRSADKTLNHFTATAGADIYRGDRLPAELRGDLFFGEPVGRLVRRAKIEVNEGVTTLRNPYQPTKSEFIRSSDPCFRPVNMITAPDGTLYIVDMYRGVIQENVAVPRGSYLRKVVEQYSLDKIVGYGRIWRLVHDGITPGPQPKMFGQASAELVAALAHPNGWWRDTAQKLLILRQDKSVTPALVEMARNHQDIFARFHAFWTLEGLDALTPAVVRTMLANEHADLRGAAIRAGESLSRKGDTSLQGDLPAMAADRDPTVAMQALLTAKSLGWPDAASLIDKTIASAKALGVKEIGGQLLHPQVQETTGLSFTPAQKKIMAAGAATYNTLCVSCHGPDGKGAPMIGAAPGAKLAPALAASKLVTGRAEGPIYVMLHGLTGDIDGKNYGGQMISMAGFDSQWIASALSFVRNSFGNAAGFVTAEDVTRYRAATRERTQPWTMPVLRASLPKTLSRSEWKTSASHNSATTALAIDGNVETRFTTGTPQVPGMWIQVELPTETTISAVTLDTAGSPEDYPRAYEIACSIDGRSWDKPIATGRGDGPRTEIAIESRTAKFVRITQTGSDPRAPWSIHELQIYAPAITTQDRK